MKLELDITADAVVDQVAKHLMGYVVRDETACGYDPDEDVEPETTAPRYGRDRSTIADMVKNIVAERTRRAVDAAVEKVTEERIAEAVDKVLAEGWRKTNNWGEPTGPATNLRGRINEILHQNIERDYRHKGARIDVIIGEAIEAALGKEFKPLLEAAAAKFKAALEGTIAAKLQETLKAALGLR